MSGKRHIPKHECCFCIDIAMPAGLWRPNREQCCVCHYNRTKLYPLPTSFAAQQADVIRDTGA